jgi:hypothetical protein
LIRSAILPFVFLGAAVLCAQDPASSSQDNTQPPKERSTPAYVRRFSMGASVDLIGGLNVFSGGSSSQPYGTNSKYNSVTHPKYHVVSGGLMLQFRLTEKVSVNTNFLYRKGEYNNTTDFGAVTIPPVEPTIIHERTRVLYWETPVLLRVYNKRSHRPGRRWFFEGGPTMRSIFRVRTDRDITDPDGNVSYDHTPAKFAKKRIPGVIGGLGFQVIDPVGVRIIPEVRYTRWLDRNFDAFPTRSRKNQVEFVISLSF